MEEGEPPESRPNSRSTEQKQLLLHTKKNNNKQKRPRSEEVTSNFWPDRKKKAISSKKKSGEEVAPVSSLGHNVATSPKLKSVPDKLKTKEQPPEDTPFYCKIFRRLSPVVRPDNMATVNIGFIKLGSRSTSTFEDARKAISKDLVPEFLPHDLKWRFFINALGPMSSTQEKYSGALVPFLEDASPETTIGKGSARDPVSLVLIESSTLCISLLD